MYEPRHSRTTRIDHPTGPATKNPGGTTFRWTLLLWAVAVGTGLPACKDADRQVERAIEARIPEDARKVPETQHPKLCRADSYFVELDLHTATPWADSRFVRRVADRMEKFSQVRKGFWFGWDGLDSRDTIRVDVEPVLSAWPGTVPAARVGGEHRFFRFRFRHEDRVLSVEESARCDVVRLLRATFTELADRAVGGWTGPGLSREQIEGIRVGRECDPVAALQDPASKPSRSMPPERKDWHLRALDVPGAGAPASVLEKFTVAVVDGPPETPVSRKLSAAFHARAVANVIQSVAPQVQLRFYRALDERGDGTTADVARALDAALRDAHARIPSHTVVNMSLGFPPHKRRSSPLEGVTVGGLECRTVEDGVGESLRYLLHVAQRMDEDPSASVTVVSAAGNRPQRARELRPKQPEIMSSSLPAAVVGQETIFRLAGSDRAVDVIPPANGRAVQVEVATSRLPPGVRKTKDGDLAVKPPEDGAGSKARVRLRAVCPGNGTEHACEVTLPMIEAGRCSVHEMAPHFFYPAEWERQRTCPVDSESGAEPRGLTWAAGSINSQLYRSALSPQSLDPRLMGPGEYVNVSQKEEEPIYLSGTSFAAASISGLAAQAQAIRVGMGRPAFREDILKRMIRATGSVCRMGPAQTEYVVPSLASYQEALMKCAVDDIPQCVQPSAADGGDAPCREQLKARCDFEPPECDLGTERGGDLKALAKAPRPQSGSSYASWPKARTYDFEVPWCRADFAGLAGVVPLQKVPVCATCTGDRQDPLLILDLQLNPGLQGSHQILAAYLVALPQDGSSAPAWELPLQANPPPWVGGGSIQQTVDWSQTPSQGHPMQSYRFLLKTELQDLGTAETIVREDPIWVP